MKRLLFLMLVLGLASAAYGDFPPGAFSLWVSPDSCSVNYVEGVDSEVLIWLTETRWIGVHNSIQGTPGINSMMGQFILGIGRPPEYPALFTWTGNWMQYKPPLTAGAPGNEYLGIIDVGLPVMLDAWWLDLSEPSATAYNGVGILDAKELLCVFFYGDEIIYLLNADDGSVLDTLIIHQVPEPMTITLLGLGGLMLRKRRA